MPNMQLYAHTEVNNGQVVQSLHGCVGAWFEQNPYPNKWQKVLTQVHSSANNQPTGYEIAQLEKAIKYQNKGASDMHVPIYMATCTDLPNVRALGDANAHPLAVNVDMGLPGQDGNNGGYHRGKVTSKGGNPAPLRRILIASSGRCFYAVAKPWPEAISFQVYYELEVTPPYKGRARRRGHEAVHPQEHHDVRGQHREQVLRPDIGLQLQLQGASAQA